MIKRTPWNWLSYVAVLASGVILGAGVVFFLQVRPAGLALADLLLSQSDEETYLVYRFGDYRVTREKPLKHLQESRSANAVRTHRTTLWYGRLALAAERAGHHNDASDFWRRAVASDPSGRLDEASIRDAVLRLDAAWTRRVLGAAAEQSGPIPPQNKPLERPGINPNADAAPVSAGRSAPSR
jgi:hypothetical protein